MTVFSVNPDHDHLPGAEIADHLARHGVKTDVRHTIASDIDVGDAVPDMANPDDEVPLLVMTRVVRYRTTNRELRRPTRRDR